MLATPWLPASMENQPSGSTWAGDTRRIDASALDVDSAECIDLNVGVVKQLGQWTAAVNDHQAGDVAPLSTCGKLINEKIAGS
jgi:hypothetical protein